MAIDEGVPGRGLDDARTLALSDGVFAIALTLLVLSIHLPDLAAGHEDELGRRLYDQRSELFSWLLSFWVIGSYWVRHRGLFDDVERVDGTLTWLNLAYLGGVAFLPYPTQVLAAYGDEPAAVAIYSVTLALVSGLGAVMTRHGLRAGLFTAAGTRRQAARVAGAPWWLVPGVILLAIPASFLVGSWALLVWLALLGLRRGRQAASDQ